MEEVAFAACILRIAIATNALVQPVSIPTTWSGMTEATRGLYLSLWQDSDLTNGPSAFHSSGF